MVLLIYRGGFMGKPMPSRPDLFRAVFLQSGLSRETEDTRRTSHIENKNMSRVYLFETEVHLAII